MKLYIQLIEYIAFVFLIVFLIFLNFFIFHEEAPIFFKIMILIIDIIFIVLLVKENKETLDFLLNRWTSQKSGKVKV